MWALELKMADGNAAAMKEKELGNAAYKSKNFAKVFFIWKHVSVICDIVCLVCRPSVTTRQLLGWTPKKSPSGATWLLFTLRTRTLRRSSDNNIVTQQIHFCLAVRQSVRESCGGGSGEQGRLQTHREGVGEVKCLGLIWFAILASWWL